MLGARAGSGWVGSLCVAPAQGMARLALLLRRTAFAAAEHDALTVAQAVAYSAMVALFPTLIVAAAVIGLVPDYVLYGSELGMFFLRVLPSNAIPVLEGYFSVSHKSQTAGALLGSLGVSFLGAANVMSTLMEGFRRAHELPSVPGSFWQRRARAVALVPLSLVPMTATSALVVFGNALTRWLARDVPGELQSTFSVFALVLRWTTALAGSAAVIGLIYHLGTDLRLDVLTRLEPWVREPWNALRKTWTWRAGLPGAVLATALWFAATLLFGFYVTRFANYTRVYGSLGAAIALMAWLYIIALCVLVGSEFNAQISRSAREAEGGAALWTRPG